MQTELCINELKYKMFLPFKDTDMIQRHIYMTKSPYELDLLQHMLAKLKDEKINEGGGIVLDIGMNIGNHTCFFAAHGIKVIGFEPNPKIFAIAQENVKINHFEERVKIFPYGISSHSHKANMSKENPGNFGNMHLIEDENASIECKSIDSFEFKEKIVLMKIDVEGMELEVL